MLDAVLAHQIRCEDTKRILAMVKVWSINMLVFVLQMVIRVCLVFLSRATRNMLWREDEFKTCILTDVSFMQNEYGLGKE